MNIIALSYGGGWQSVAMCVLVRQGRLPKPDLVVIADTGREVRSTWTYLREVMQPYLDPIGLTIQVASHTLARVDLYAEDGLTLMPAYTEDGRLPSFCSGEWKRDVCERWLRLQQVKECVLWIGYSIDEVHRVSRKDHRPWCKLDFPLINLFINRAMCRGIIEAAGLPMPKKSRCFQCPHQRREEWLEVRADPEQWAEACRLDREMRAKDPEQAGLYLHSSRVPLEQVNLDGELDKSGGKLCADGSCWT